MVIDAAAGLCLHMRGARSPKRKEWAGSAVAGGARETSREEFFPKTTRVTDAAQPWRSDLRAARGEDTG